MHSRDCPYFYTFDDGSLSEYPFRQLGQIEDEDTGLYYNRFRWYSADTGLYISQDPIGLAGNNPTLYGYVENCNLQVDVWGLSGNLLEGTPIGKILLPNSTSIGKSYQTQPIFKIEKRVKVDGATFKPGDYYYLDNVHRDHIEVFSKRHESKGVFNTDGTYNKSKSQKAKSRVGPCK